MLTKSAVTFVCPVVIETLVDELLVSEIVVVSCSVMLLVVLVMYNGEVKPDKLPVVDSVSLVVVLVTSVVLSMGKVVRFNGNVEVTSDTVGAVTSDTVGADVVVLPVLLACGVLLWDVSVVVERICVMFLFS